MLVEEITSTVDNFGVYIDNYHCDVNDQVSCPRTLIVRHETHEVLIKTLQMMPIKVQVCGGHPWGHDVASISPWPRRQRTELQDWRGRGRGLVRGPTRLLSQDPQCVPYTCHPVHLCGSPSPAPE